MSTVRFSEVVKAAGKPEVHLLLTDPQLDHALQKAVKDERVMTIHQTVVGNKADFGTVGLVQGVTGQVLVFPKPIAWLKDRNVVGIKYDLLSQEGTRPRKKPAKPALPAKQPQRARRKVEEGNSHQKKLVEFPRQLSLENGDGEAGPEIKRPLKRALAALSDGKQVVAYKILQDLLNQLK